MQGRDNPRFIFIFCFCFNKHHRKNKFEKKEKIIASQKIGCWNFWQAQRLCHTELQGWKSWHIIAIDARFWCSAQENLWLPTASCCNTFVYIRLTETLLHASKRAKMSSIGNQKISDELHSFGAIAQQSFSNDDLHIYRLQSGLFKNDFMILRKLNASKSLCFLPHLSITDMSNSD